MAKIHNFHHMVVQVAILQKNNPSATHSMHELQTQNQVKMLLHHIHSRALACSIFGLSHWPICSAHIATNTHTHPFNGPFSGTTQVSRYQKGRTNLDFTEATDSDWQWHQLGQMQIWTSLQTDNHASTPQLSFLQAGCPSGRPTNSVKALKAHSHQVPH